MWYMLNALGTSAGLKPPPKRTKLALRNESFIKFFNFYFRLPMENLTKKKKKRKR